MCYRLVTLQHTVAVRLVPNTPILLSCTVRWWHLHDIDGFFRHVYHHYDAKGLYNIVSKGVLDHLRVVVVVMIILFLTVVIDYKQLNDVRKRQCSSLCTICTHTHTHTQSHTQRMNCFRTAHTRTQTHNHTLIAAHTAA